MTVSQLALSFLGVLFCFGDVATLGFLLTWRERAATPSLRRLRLLRGVLPGAAVLVALLLVVLVRVMLLWSGQ